MVAPLLFALACAEPDVFEGGEFDEGALDAWLADDPEFTEALDASRVDAAGGVVYWGDLRLAHVTYIAEPAREGSRSGGDVDYDVCWGSFWLGIFADGTVYGRASCRIAGRPMQSGRIDGTATARRVNAGWDNGTLIVAVSASYDGSAISGTLWGDDGSIDYWTGGIGGVVQ